MEQKPIYSTFKYYTHKGRRVNIFAMKEKRGNPEDSKDIFIIYVFGCSKHDTFSKKFGRERFQLYLKNKSLGIEDKLKIDIFPQQEEFTKHDFIEFCNLYYYKIREEETEFYGIFVSSHLKKSNGIFPEGSIIVKSLV